MIQRFVDRFLAAETAIKAEYTAARPESYDVLVKRVVQALASDTSDFDRPDPERIHVIDDGNYQGLRLFIIGADGYQPSLYWLIAVDYGSCSGCDSFEAARSYKYGDEPTDEKEVSDYWSMMLHMVQSMTLIYGHEDPA